MELKRVGGFRARNMENKVRAPELAYQIVYGKKPTHSLMWGYAPSPKKRYNDMLIDEHLPEDVIGELNSISQIEMRSSCEGHDSDRLAFVIFRPVKQKLSYVQKIVSKIIKCKNTYCGYDVGNRGMYRICVATKNWYRGDDADNSKWLQWWMNLPQCINQSL